MNRTKIFSILFFCLIYNIVIKTFYRPYIYSNKINDFGFADIGNNLTFIPAIYFLCFLVKGKFLFSKYKDIIFHFLFLSSIEVITAFVPNIGTFDYKDIFGLFIGSLMLYFFLPNEN